MWFYQGFFRLHLEFLDGLISCFSSGFFSRFSFALMSKGVVATAGRPVESQRVIKTPPYHFTLLGHDFSQNHHSPNMRNLYICGNAHVLDRLHQAMTSHKSHIFREFLDLGLPIASRLSVANFAKVTTGPRLPSSDGPRLRRATSSVSSSWPRRGGLEVDSGGDSSSA